MCFSFNVVVRIPCFSISYYREALCYVRSYTFAFQPPPFHRHAAETANDKSWKMCVYMLSKEVNVMCASFLSFLFSHSLTRLMPVARRCYYLGHEKKNAPQTNTTKRR